MMQKTEIPGRSEIEKKKKENVTKRRVSLAWSEWICPPPAPAALESFWKSQEDEDEDEE